MTGCCDEECGQTGCGLAARSGHNDHDAPKPGCRDGQTGCGLAARSGHNDHNAPPNQGAVTGKRGAGWQPAAATVITMRPNRGAVTGHVAERGAGC